MKSCMRDIITPSPAYTSCGMDKAAVTCLGLGGTFSRARIALSTQGMTSADTEQREAHDERSSTGIILGATLGPVAVLVLVGVLIWMYQGCKKGGEEKQRSSNGGEAGGEGGDGRHDHWSTATTDGSSHWTGY